MTRRVLIVVNLAGFLCFLENDFRQLRSMGCEIEVAADGRMPNGDEAVELAKLRKAGIRFHQLSLDTKNPFSTLNLSAYKKIRRVIREGCFDLIICHTPIPGMLARLAALRERRTRGIKVMYVTHGFTFCKGTPLKSWFMYYPMEFLFSSLCDVVITINNEDYRNAKHMLCKKVYKLPGVGVDVGRMELKHFDREGYRFSIDVDKDDIMVLSVGELSLRKNHRVIVEALGMLPDKNRYVYVVCGRDVACTGIAHQLSEFACSKGVRIKLLGHRSDIPELNNCADIAALPSLREGLGLAGIEAMAAGVPVVGSNVQGIRDYVVNGKTGYLCNPRLPNQFASAIERLSHMDKCLRSEISQNCRQMACNFSKSHSAAELAAIYQDVL